MPLTSKGSEIMEAMKKEYGPDAGERVFYASKNAGTITGVDSEDAVGDVTDGIGQRAAETIAEEFAERNESLQDLEGYLNSLSARTGGGTTPPEMKAARAAYQKRASEIQRRRVDAAPVRDVAPALLPPPITLDEMNQRNREFWKR